MLYSAVMLVILSACTAKVSDKAYSWEDDLRHRLLVDFCLTEAQVKDYIRKYIPDVTDEQMRKWEDDKSLEYMVLDGENAILEMQVLICSGWIRCVVI